MFYIYIYIWSYIYCILSNNSVLSESPLTELLWSKQKQILNESEHKVSLRDDGV